MKGQNHKLSTLLFGLMILFALPAAAVDRVTASLSVTNGTTNGQTITVNGNVRTWTNSVFLPASQVLTNATAAGSKSNLFEEIGLSPFSQVTIQDKGASNIDFVEASGLTLTVTLSAGWGTVS